MLQRRGEKDWKTCKAYGIVDRHGPRCQTLYDTGFTKRSIVTGQDDKHRIAYSKEGSVHVLFISTSRKRATGLHADYGLRVPIGAIVSTGLGCVLVVIGTIIVLRLNSTHTFNHSSFAFALLILGVIWLTGGIWLVISSSIGRRYQRKAMVAAASLQGSETVLDLGTGTGFIAVALAQTLREGVVHGIDIWSQSALPAPSPEIARRNAEIEGVSSRVQIDNGHASAIPYPPNTFDVVTVYRVLHTFESPIILDHAVYEIARVLKPGGRAVICESLQKILPFPPLFEDHGLIVKERRLSFTALPPIGILIVEKPLHRH